MKRKFFIRTFGCQMNKHDSERIAGLLLSEGHKPVATPEESDLIIFNTCAVRGHAEDRLFGNINSLADLKKRKPRTLIAVGGCVAQKEQSGIFKRAPLTDIVFGTFNINELNRLIIEAEDAGETVLSLSTGFNVLQTALPSKRESKFLAWVPVSIGCKNYCSYCVVPYVRGEEASRPREEIVEEVKNLVDEGVLEVTLLGQNVNSYGSDIYGENSFAGLLNDISEVPGLERIRFATSHPKDLTMETISVIAGNENICKYLHLPVQSGSNSMLEAMNRGYTREHYLKLVERIKKEVPDVALGTDIIVGFPGETEKDFEQTCEIARTIGFDSMFTFIYSPREGTAAYKMKDDVPRKEKVMRLRILGEILKETAQLNNDKYLNSKVKVLVEGKAKKGKGVFSGKTPTNKTVVFRGEPGLIGKIIELKITEAHPYHLVGVLPEKVNS